jgi:membrane-associated phospholipid phosphatase
VSIPPDGNQAVTRPRAPRARATVPPAVVSVVVGCLALVLLLGVGVRAGFAPQLRLDTAVSRAVYAGDHRSARIDGMLQVVTGLGLSAVRLVVAVPVLVLLLRRRAVRTSVWVVVAVALIGPLTTLVKDVVGRLRPQFADGGARIQSLSFPSGHSSGIATAVTVGLLLAWPLLSTAGRRVAVAVGVFLVVVVGMTRMWLGVHYLSDVVAGWSLGIAWALLTAFMLGALPGGRAALVPRP